MGVLNHEVLGVFVLLIPLLTPHVTISILYFPKFGENCTCSQGAIYTQFVSVYTQALSCSHTKINTDAIRQGGSLHENWTPFVSTVPRTVPITSALWTVHHHTKLARSHPFFVGSY